ncbi:MAG: HEPN domain-containing protein [Planctomycetes bacterium]|nr:HEPN domain-containing protein [Planctomycetota bacterium]
MPLGTDDYREGAMLRLFDAQVLRDGQAWIGAMYLAGRAAEAVLRGLLWCEGREQEIGHDLRDLVKRVRSLSTLADRDRIDLDRLEDDVNELAAIWRNDLRYTGSKRFDRMLKESKRFWRIGGKPVKGDPEKANALSVLEACERIVSVGEPLCQRYRKG